MTAYWRSSHVKGMLACKQNHQVFRMITQTMVLLEIDLFVSRQSYQIQSYHSWPYTHCIGVDVLAKVESKRLYAFMTFALIQQIVRKVEVVEVDSQF